MKALLLTAPRKLSVVDVPEPELADDAVLVRVAACGVCGSDVHGYDGSSGRRIPPLIMGHEAAGVVERIGPAVDRAQVGDRVALDSMISCGRCPFCRRGQTNLCDHRQVLGVSCGDYRRHGAFAQFVAVPQSVVYRLPDQLTLERAALLEAVSVAVHAAARTPLTQGDATAVIGVGMIGLLVVQALRASGATNVIAVDVDPHKLALARQFGAAAVVDADASDPIAAVRELTGGRGVDASFEVVGATPAFRTAVECVRKGGSVTLVGNICPTVEAPLQSIVTRELTLIGSCASQGEFSRCVDLLASGAIDVDPLISARAPLEEGPRWFDRLFAHEPGLFKVLLTPER